MKSSTTNPQWQPPPRPTGAIAPPLRSPESPRQQLAETKFASGADVKIAALDVRESGDRVVVRFREFEGRHFVDVRLHRRSQTGEFVPTAKGLSVRLDEVFLLHDAIGKACELAKTVKR